MNISAPLNKRLKADLSDNIESLTCDHETAFQELIDAETTPALRDIPKNGLPYSVDTDASDYQVGAELFQTDEDGISRPLGYWSRSFNVH